LRHFRDAYQSGQRSTIEELARSALKSFPEGSLLNLSAIDARGFLAFSVLAPGERTYLGDRDYFVFHRNSSAEGLYITKPVVSRLTGGWVVLISRPIFRQGKFAGVVNITLDPRYLAAMLARLDMATDDVATLIYHDGSYLARSRDLAGALGKSVPADRPFLAPGAPARGSLRFVAAFDGVPRLYGWNRLEVYPFIALVGIDERALLAPVSAEIAVTRLRSAVGNVLILSLVLVVAMLLLRMARQHAALLKSKERFERTAETVPVALYDYVMNPDGSNRFAYMSRRSKEIFGVEAETIMADANAFWSLVDPEDLTRLQQEDKTANESGTTFNTDFRITTPGGELKWLHVESKPNPTGPGEPEVWSGFVMDITDRKRVENELLTMATTDFLTGLPSRRSFIIRLEDELARLNRAIEQPIALLMLDLDHFKNVNDSYGHATGDSMLKHFANLVANELRRIDMAGRLGGEEFGIVLPGADVAAAKAFAERLCERIGNSPLLLNGSRIPFTVSIGVTHLRISDTDPDVALARADKFLYRAKERGRNRVEVDDELASA
jgi:diguanylate cyclase (GGDEF)-like protein/PAS domain S-box-containing protein